MLYKAEGEPTAVGLEERETRGRKKAARRPPLKEAASSALTSDSCVPIIVLRAGKEVAAK